ncbi:MAG: UDP-N-acetylmuramoyl-L-alanine--D-glutamate ligase [Erysipelotrichaceae bacterium]|nr:UDP-N-acetylmuramoyl-L-alanine--D-glutamate ligase [Erysipelotrichaceae bacterium]
METILVVGAARSGLAVSRLLKKKGYEVILTDLQPIKEKEELEKEGIQVFDNGHPGSLKDGEYPFIVKNPGIPYSAPFIHFFVEKQVPIYTEIEVAYRLAPEFSYGAITGTDGKTTVTTLLYEMLNHDRPALVAGNIGIPLSEVVLHSDGTKKNVALELSNFQLLGTDTFKAHISTITNLAPDHMDYMDSLEAYYISKMKIYRNAGKQDFFIRNIDDPLIVKYAQDIPCQVIDFSLKEPEADLCVKDGKIYYHDIVLFEKKDLKIVGDFNCGNAMMAACMAYELGVSIDTIREVISSFTGVEHRIEYVDNVNGIRFYNDSKATNTHSACAALSAFDQPVILLCGGKDKHLSFEDMKQYDGKVKHCFSFGQTKDAFSQIFTHQTSCERIEEAFHQAVSLAEQGDVILLSPACSSFDQFTNYEVRGQVFKELVAGYAKKGK